MTEQATSEAPAVVAELDLAARLEVILGKVADAADRLARARERERIQWEDCHTIPLATLASPAAGPIVDERWQPRQGWAWQVLLLTVTFGAGATGAVVYEAGDATGIIASNALHSFVPDANSMASWEPKGLLLLPGNPLAWSSAGGGITVTGRAVEVRLPRLPDYLL